MEKFRAPRLAADELSNISDIVFPIDASFRGEVGSSKSEKLHNPLGLFKSLISIASIPWSSSTRNIVFLSKPAIISRVFVSWPCQSKEEIKLILLGLLTSKMLKPLIAFAEANVLSLIK